MIKNRDKPEIQESTSKHVKLMASSSSKNLAAQSVADLKSQFDKHQKSQPDFEIFSKITSQSFNQDYLDSYPEQSSTPKNHSQDPIYQNRHSFEESKISNFTQVLATPNKPDSPENTKNNNETDGTLSYNNFDKTLKSKASFKQSL